MLNNKQLKSALLLLIPLGVIINNVIALYKMISLRHFDTDELLHTHIAWNIFQGKLPYHDFFELHGPLYGILNGFIFSVLNQAASFESLLLLRKISLMASCLIGLLLFFIALEMTKSNRIACFSVAIFFMWDIVQHTAIEIRPDLLQNLFWLLGFYLFIKFHKCKKPVAMLSCGFLLGLMLCFNFKAILSCFVIFGFLLVEFFRSRSKTTIQDLLFIVLGASLPVLSTMSYFYIKGGLQDFIYYTTLFNIGLTNSFSKLEIPQKLHTYAFFTLDAALTFFCLYGLQYIHYKSRSFQFMFLCIIAGAYGITQGLYLHNCLTFIPFCSIIAAIGLNQLILRRFYSQHLSMIQFSILLATLWVCCGTPMNNLLLPPQVPEEAFENTRNNINWVLGNIPREQTVATLWSDCGGNVFNADPGFYWLNNYEYLGKNASARARDEGLLFNLEEYHTPIIAIYPQDLSTLPQATKLYIISNYRLLPINPQNNCIGVRK